jgi:hypothetical protein
LREEKQGSELATFLLCPSCKIVLAVGYINKDFSVGSFNALLLNDVDKLQKSVVVSPKALGKAEKVARWRKLWSQMLVEVI